MNSQESFSTGFTPHELFNRGRAVWLFKTLFPEDYKIPIGDWLDHRQDLANLPKVNLKHVQERELTRRNRMRRPASSKVGDRVMVHHLRLPMWPRNCLQDPFFGDFRIIRINGSRIHVRCSPRLGGELLCAPKQLRHYHSSDELSWDGWGLSEGDVERIELEGAANPEEADELEEMTADKTAVDDYYVVLHGTSINRAGISLPCGTDMGYLRQPGSPCQPLYSRMGVSIPSFVPTSLRTRTDSH